MFLFFTPPSQEITIGKIFICCRVLNSNRNDVPIARCTSNYRTKQTTLVLCMLKQKLNFLILTTNHTPRYFLNSLFMCPQIQLCFWYNYQFLVLVMPVMKCCNLHLRMNKTKAEQNSCCIWILSWLASA